MNIKDKMNLMVKLGNTSRRLIAHHPERGNEHFGGGQMGMLDIIVDNPGISQDELADKLDLDKTTVAKAVKKLEMHGIIQRKKSETDGRKFEIYAEAKAKKIKDTSKTQREERCDLAFENIDDDTLIQLKNTLDKIEKNIDKNNLDMRKRKIESIKKMLNIISSNPGMTKEELFKNSQMPEELFDRVVGGLEQQDLIEIIGGEHFITDKGKNFDEEKLRDPERRPPHPPHDRRPPHPPRDMRHPPHRDFNEER